MMTRQQAEKTRLNPAHAHSRLGGRRLRSGDYGGLVPLPPPRRLMDRLNIDVQSIDLIELNEAFAAQALAVMNDLRLDPARVNVNGGAIAPRPPGRRQRCDSAGQTDV